MPNATRLPQLNADVTLPNWLQKYLFEKLGAQYAPDHSKYSKNLNIEGFDLQTYLGTYFPRSYAECFCIYDNIFENKVMFKELKDDCIEILSIGCGTGGDVVGLIVALLKYDCAEEIRITLIDGNQKAMDLAIDIITHIKEKHNLNLSINRIDCTISQIADLPKLTHRYNHILSFKMINELVGSGQLNAYYDFAKFCLPMLKDNGILLLCDVTNKVGNDYNPVLMNMQINQYLSQNKEYKCLIPLSCRKNAAKCKERCYTQRCFHVSHRLKNKDKSLVSYKIIGNSSFIDSLPIVIDNQRFMNNTEKKVLCAHSQLGSHIEIDNFKI